MIAYPPLAGKFCVQGILYGTLGACHMEKKILEKRASLDGIIGDYCAGHLHFSKVSMTFTQFCLASFCLVTRGISCQNCQTSKIEHFAKIINGLSYSLFS